MALETDKRHIRSRSSVDPEHIKSKMKPDANANPDTTTPLKPAESNTSLPRPVNGKYKLVTYAELPEWLKDNDYIWSSYRPPLHSIKLCLASIFRIHTESGNIWTHLLGFFLFVGLAIHLFFFSGHTLSPVDKFMFSIYFMAVLSCLGFSTTYHCFTCHSKECACLCRKFDYCGISILITGSFVPWTYYGFYDEPIPKYFYISLVTVIGTIVSFFSLSDKFGSSEFRAIRAVIFIIFGVSTALPFIHFFFFSKHYVPVDFPKLLAFGFCYIFGASLYACRVPERYFPGKCDIFFQSHQIFHTFVVVAAYIHYENIQEIAFQRISNNVN